MTIWTCIDCGQRFGEPTMQKETEFRVCPYCQSRKIISGQLFNIHITITIIRLFNDIYLEQKRIFLDSQKGQLPLFIHTVL